MAKDVANQFIDQLRSAGVRRIYGIVGDSLNPVVDAVRQTGGSAKGGIDWVHVRHEEAAAFAAAADAQLTGQLAVCAGSCGPGNLHLINGLYDANRSKAPVLAIASHIPSAQIGSGFFQETHPDRLFNECSVYSEMVSTAEQAPRVMHSAIQHAVGLRGVSVVTLPGDIAAHDAVAPTPLCAPFARGALVPDESAVGALAAAINRLGQDRHLCRRGRGGRTRRASRLRGEDRCAHWPHPARQGLHPVPQPLGYRDDRAARLRRRGGRDRGRGPAPAAGHRLPVRPVPAARGADGAGGQRPGASGPAHRRGPGGAR